MPRRSRRAGKASRAVAALPSLFGLAPRKRRGRGHDPMLYPFRPTDAQVQDLLARSRGLPLSYPDVGVTSGRRPHATSATTTGSGSARGRGTSTGRARRSAVGPCSTWAGSGPGRRTPRSWKGRSWPSWRDGFGVWAAFTCRVIRVWEDRGPVESLGFTLRHPAGPPARRGGAVRGRLGPPGRLGLVRHPRRLAARGSAGACRLSPDPTGPETVRAGLAAGDGPSDGSRRMRTIARVPASPGTGRRYRQLTVLAGGLVWATSIGALRPGWPGAMLLLASLVVVPTRAGPSCDPRAARRSHTTLGRRARAPGPGGVGPGRVVRPLARPGGRGAGPPVAGDHRRGRPPRTRPTAGRAPDSGRAVPGRRAGLPRRRRGVGRHCKGGPPPAGLPRRHRPDDRRPLPLRRVRPAGAGGACRRGSRRAGGGGRLPRGGRGGPAGCGRDHRRAADAGPPAAQGGRAGRHGGDGDGGGPRGVCSRSGSPPGRTGPRWPGPCWRCRGPPSSCRWAWPGSTCSGPTAKPSGSTSRACSATTAPSTPWGSPCPACWPGTSRRGQEGGSIDEEFSSPAARASSAATSPRRSGRPATRSSCSRAAHVRSAQADGVEVVRGDVAAGPLPRRHCGGPTPSST